MERKDIHLQISAIIDKLSYLNKNLSEEKVALNVELDLLKAYANELQDLAQLLELQKSSLQLEAIEPEHATSEEVSPEIAKQKIQKSGEVQNENDAQIEKSKAEEYLPESENPAQYMISEESFNTGKNDEEENVSLNEKFKMTSFELGDKLKFGEIKNLKDKIDLNERYVFIQELFEGDAEHFNKSLRQLDECNSVEQAQDYIKSMLEKKYSWEEKQKHALRFIELVLNNFDEKNKN